MYVRRYVVWGGGSCRPVDDFFNIGWGSPNGKRHDSVAGCMLVLRGLGYFALSVRKFSTAQVAFCAFIADDIEISQGHEFILYKQA